MGDESFPKVSGYPLPAPPMILVAIVSLMIDTSTCRDLGGE
jgi:hypothetical protein